MVDPPPPVPVCTRPAAQAGTRQKGSVALPLSPFGVHRPASTGHAHPGTAATESIIVSSLRPSMAADPDCLFCKIVAGEVPSTRVHEDERTIAFMDINPGTRGHLLVIPREHATDLLEIADEDLAAVARTGKVMAQRITERLGADGVNLLNSCGAAAWQTVFHFHLHVIPRYHRHPPRLPVTAEPGGR